MTKKQRSLSMSVALLSGSIVGMIGFSLSLRFLYPAFLLFLVVLVWIWDNRQARSVVLALLLFSLALLRVSTLPTPPALSQFQGTGVIVSLPESGEKTQRFTVRLDRANRHLTLLAPLYPEYRYGQWIDLTCTAIENGFCSFPEIHVLADGKGNPLLHKLFAVKAMLAENLKHALPEPHAGFARAMILGQRGGIAPSLREMLTRTGINHIVAISGMHIVVLSQVLAIILTFFPFHRKTRFVLSAALLTAFTAMIGAPASAVRGLLFGLLLLLAQYTGRIRTMTPALLWTAAVMLLIRPSFLFDLGFQLSFLATVGIVYGVPIFRYYLTLSQTKSRTIQSVLQLILMSLAATVTTTPLILATIGRTTLWTIPTNLLLVSALEFILPGILLVAIVAPVPLLGTVLSFALTVVFDVILGILRLFSSLPGHTIVFPAFSHATLFALYVALFALGGWLFERIPYRERTCFVTDSPSPP